MKKHWALTGFVTVMISPSLTVSSLFPGSAAKSYITRACREWTGEQMLQMYSKHKTQTTFSLFINTKV